MTQGLVLGACLLVAVVIVAGELRTMYRRRR